MIIALLGGFRRDNGKNQKTQDGERDAIGVVMEQPVDINIAMVLIIVKLVVRK